MARRLDASIPRPACPRGHTASRVWFDGFYSRGTNHERPRFRCWPIGATKSHVFIEPLARRRQTAANPRGGAACPECERVPSAIEGAQTGWRFCFTVREAASLLVHLGRGLSLRVASELARRHAVRYTSNLWGRPVASRHAQLSTDYLARFGQVVVEALLPSTWPDAVALDQLPVFTRIPDEDGTPRAGQTAYAVLGVYGYPSGSGQGQLWRVAVRGAGDKVEWESFLRSRPGNPSWVVSDQDRSIATAVRKAWPGAIHYSCEAHLRMLAQDSLEAEGQPRYGAAWKAARGAFGDTQRWSDFVAELNAAGARTTVAWAMKKEPMVLRQIGLYQPDRPRSTGGLEDPLKDIRDRRLGMRRLNFRNAKRLEVLLNLMLLDLRKDADEDLYADIIRRHLLAGGGHSSLGQRALDDHGRPSIWEAVWAAEKRLAVSRARNRRSFAAWRQRQTTATAPTP